MKSINVVELITVLEYELIYIQPLPLITKFSLKSYSIRLFLYPKTEEKKLHVR